MLEMSATEAARGFGKLLDLILTGETVRITRNGRAIADLRKSHPQEKKEAVDKAVKALSGIVDDPETAHCQADDLLLELLGDLGHTEVSEAYGSVIERCGGFWYA